MNETIRHPQRFLRRAAFLMSVIVIGLLVTQAALAQVQPTLAGEQFATIFGNPPTITATSCDPQGTSSFSYSATGQATGPYPGVFAETGTFTIGPQAGLFTGQVIGLQASFTITPLGPNPLFTMVTGTKQLVMPPPPFSRQTDFGTCILVTGQTEPSVVGLSSSLAYQAVITTPDGRTCTDQGIARIGMQRGPFTGASAFGETFLTSSQLVAACQGGDEEDEKVTICHRPPGNQGNAHTIRVGASAVSRHLEHGDTPGPCQP